MPDPTPPLTGTELLPRYRVEPNKPGCSCCGHNQTWSVVWTDAKGIECEGSRSFGDQDDAQDLADCMNDAYADGLAACPTPTGSREGVRETAQTLVNKLLLIHDDSRYQAVWSIAQVHHCPYSGPTYTQELAALRAALAHSDPAGGWMPLNPEHSVYAWEAGVILLWHRLWERGVTAGYYHEPTDQWRGLDEAGEWFTVAIPPSHYCLLPPPPDQTEGR